MSKRKNRNRFRFPPPRITYAQTSDQSSLPLAQPMETDTEKMPAQVGMAAAQTQAPEPTLATDVDVHEQPLAPEPVTIAPDQLLGQRLRAAREARGWSCADAASALKLPVSVLQSLETEQFERIGYGVYLRGYLNKYLQLLDLPHVLADRVLQQHQELPPLTTAITMSRPRYLFERYSGAALYLLLTAVFIVPAVLLATRGGLDKHLARIAPLDTAPLPAAAQAPKPFSTTVAATEAASGAQTAPAHPSQDDAPLAASMTPYAAAPAASVKAPEPAHRLQLSLHQTSWVEIVDASGNRLEYGLLPAGSVHDYSSERELDVRIGNAEGATLALDGKPLDLAAYRRANVAHLKIADGVVTSMHSGG